MKHLITLRAIKDKIMLLPLMLTMFIAEMIFRSLHWQTHVRLKAAIANKMGQNAFWVHKRITGEDAIKAVRDEAEKARHKKFNKFKTP